MPICMQARYPRHAKRDVRGGFVLSAGYYLRSTTMNSQCELADGGSLLDYLRGLCRA